MSLLRVEDLSITFDNGVRRVDAVRRISFNINKGDMLALVGESGSGKSVTAQAILRLNPSNAALSGTIEFDGKDLTTLPEPDLCGIRGKRIAMIFQEPMSALNPLHTISKQIAEVITTHETLPAAAVQARVLSLLDMVGLESFKNRLDAYPHQLSGGERQRVMIAMAMACNPDLLIADEPTTALDVTLQTQILSLLKRLQQERQMAILLITHDLTLVKRLAERVIIMQHGHIVEQGNTRTVFAAPQHAYTQMLLNSEPSGSALALPANAAVVLSCTDLNVHFPIKRGLLARVRGQVKAVDAVSLTVRQGETIGIVGESGSGKTTLGLALLRLVRSHGPIVFMGNPIHSLSQRDVRPLRSNLQIVFQDPFASLNPRMMIGDIIAEGLQVHSPSLSAVDREQEVTTILQQVGLEADMRNRYPHEFSGGQRQRINIARAMILKPSVVVLDEPTSALDLSVQSKVIDLLKQFQKTTGVAYLFISHDLRVVRAISHHIMVLRQGRLVEENDTATLLSSPQHSYTKALLSAAFDADAH